MSARERDTTPGWDNPDESPEWTDEMFDRAEFPIGGEVIRPATGTFTRAFTPAEIRARRGRPPLGETAKVLQSLRLSKEVLEHFRATGPGWQARIDEVLRSHVKRVNAMKRPMAEARAAEALEAGVAKRGGGERRAAEGGEPCRGEDE